MTDNKLMELATRRAEQEIKSIQTLLEVVRLGKCSSCEYVENVCHTSYYRISAYVDGLCDAFSADYDDSIIDDIVGNFMNDVIQEINMIEKKALECLRK